MSIYEYRDIPADGYETVEEVKSERQTRAQTPPWVPLWAPSKQSMDYLATITQAFMAMLIGGFLAYHLFTRGVGPTATRVAPG